MNTRIKGRKPPRFGCAHGHSQDTHALGIHFWTAGEIFKGAELVKHHHSKEHLPLPQHELEAVFLAGLSVTCGFALAKTPAINGQRHQAFFNANGGVGGLRINAPQKLFLSETIHPGVPMHVQKTGRG